MSLPLAAVIKELESPSSVIPILKSVHAHVDVLHLSSKAELNHLVSRTINLVQAYPVYHKWCGVTVMQILINNYEILSTHGLKFFNALIKILETTNANTNLKLFNATVEGLNQLCDHIRGKPTLTREILTPKLPVIIQLFLNNIELNPSLIIKSLTKIMSHHPTTFRPFGNKLNGKLLELIKADFTNYPADLKQEICSCYAFLPIIEKTEPETVWAGKLSQVMNEIVDILNVFKDLIDVTQDEELVKGLSNPAFRLELSSQRILPFLQIDLSKPETLLQLSNNLEVLIHLFVGFIGTNTKYCIKMPIGKVITLVGIIFGFNTNFLPFKRDIREDDIKTLITSVLVNIQGSALNIINCLITTYQNPVIMYMSGLLSVLETAIPMQKKSICNGAVIKQESFMVELLNTVTNLLNLVQLYQEPQQLLRLVDMALILVEPRTESTPINNKPTSNGTGNKKLKKKNTSSVPMADLLSHSHLFANQISKHTSKAVRSFINSVIIRMELPLNQYYKIMRYIIVETVQAINYSHNNSITPELKDLLVNAIIYPGFEKVSILPIVSTILGDDPIISVFNNARFPPLPVFIKLSGYEVNPELENEEEEEEDQVEEEKPTTDNGADIVSQISLKRTYDDVNNQNTGDSGNSIDIKKVKVQAEERSNDVGDMEGQESLNVLKFKDPAPKPQVEEIQTQVTSKSDSNPSETISTTVTHTEVLDPVADIHNEDNSDFEMPSIDINDDSDDE